MSSKPMQLHHALESSHDGGMAATARISERITWLTTGGGAFALSQLVGILDHYGYEFQPWAWLVWAIFVGLLSVVCIALTVHLAWVEGRQLWARFADPKRETTGLLRPAFSPPSRFAVEAVSAPLPGAIPAGAQLRILQITPSRTAAFVISRNGEAPNLEKDDNRPLRCDFKYLGDEALLNVEIRIRLRFIEARKANGSLVSGGVLREIETTLRVPHVDRSFSFWAINRSADFVEIDFPQPARAQLAQSGGVEQIEIVQAVPPQTVLFPGPGTWPRPSPPTEAT